ncbi:hypothetical protein ABZ896_09965 [Streptomyces sp. NPDC047072]|uniref:hypothetical protein n=1 Tax=Streptomyces sp. NPDC047072 TaxID=3154809 RepID=UPI0033F8A8DB
MSLTIEHLDDLPPAPVSATRPALPAGTPILLETEDLTVLRLIAAGHRRIDIADITFSSTTAIDTRRRRLCGALAADSSEHLAALGTVYGLITRDHLPDAPRTSPEVSEDDQQILDLIVTGLNGTRIAARLQRDVGPVNTAIARLVGAFHADNRCQLAVHAVLVEAVTGRAVDRRFASKPLSSLPPFHLTVTDTGILLHTAPAQPSADSDHRSLADSSPADQEPEPTGSDQSPQKDMASIPPELATWVSNHVGRHHPWPLPIDVSGARSWRMSSPEGIIELRVPRTYGDLQREVSAHRHAINRLDDGRAPHLVGFDPRLRALLIREPRGERMDGTPGTGLHRESVHEQAGQLLRTLHDSTLGTHDRQARAAENTLRYLDYVDRVLGRIDSPVLTGRRTAVRRRMLVLREALPQLPAAFCHGCFGVGAWRWQRPTRSLALTGFTRSQLMTAVTDFARPSLLWSDQPTLQDAFFRGYGRPLDEREQLLLGDFALLAALEDLHHAIRLDDTEARLYLADAVCAAMDRLPGQP